MKNKERWIKDGKYDWKVHKLVILNYFTMFVFIVCLAWEITSNFMGMDTKFEFFNFETWGFRHFLIAICLFALLIENFLLFKSKGMNVAELMHEVEDIKKK